MWNLSKLKINEWKLTETFHQNPGLFNLEKWWLQAPANSNDALFDHLVNTMSWGGALHSGRYSRKTQQYSIMRQKSKTCQLKNPYKSPNCNLAKDKTIPSHSSLVNSQKWYPFVFGKDIPVTKIATGFLFKAPPKKYTGNSQAKAHQTKRSQDQTTFGLEKCQKTRVIPPVDLDGFRWIGCV